MFSRRKYASELGKIYRTTYGKDGLSLTNPKAYVQFFSREITVVVNYILIQMDKRVSARLDLDTLMKSMSFEIDGERKTAPPWVHGPGWRPAGASNDPNQEGEPVGNLESTAPLRAQVMAELESHREYLAKFIPHQVGSKKIDPLSESEIEELIEKDSSEQPKILGEMAEYSVESREKQGVSVLMELPDEQLTHRDGNEDLEQLEDNEKDIDEFQPNQEFDDLVDAYGNTKAIRDAEAKKVARDQAKSRKRNRNKNDPTTEEESTPHSMEFPRKRIKTTKNSKLSFETGSYNLTWSKISNTVDFYPSADSDLESIRAFSPESEESFGDETQHEVPTDAQTQNPTG